jgi:fructokinase
VLSVESELNLRGTVGVAMPGALSPATGLIKNANSTYLIGHALDRDLAAALNRPVRLANDADCFALSEALDGAGAGYPSLFGVILGTGVGGGIVINGALVSGPNTIAGEWGHNPLPWPAAGEWPGPPCYCGKTGCIESFLAGPALERDYEALGGTRLKATEIASRAGYDPAAEAALVRYEARLARALAHVINILDPHVIVLGGGLSGIDRLYGSVPALWGSFIFSDRVDTLLIKARHGPSSGVRGAARLWPENA